MQISNHSKNLTGLLLASFFISTSGVLGKYIALDSEVIIWYRSFIGMIFLLIFNRIKKTSLKIQDKKDHVPLLISSVLMGAHWLTYFYALKVSNVAVGMVSLYTFPVITAFLEPLFFKTKFNPVHLLLACIVFLGIYILAPELDLGSSTLQGVLWGILSALFYSIRNLILKSHVDNYNGRFLMLYQTAIISIISLPALYFFDISNSVSQMPYLLLIGLLTTAIGHSLMVQSFRHFSVTTATIISSGQPIFGVLIAYFTVEEAPSWNTFVGGLLILTTVVIESIRAKKA